MFFLRVLGAQRNKAFRDSTAVSLSKFARFWVLLFVSLLSCRTAVGSAPHMTKIEFVLVTPDSRTKLTRRKGETNVFSGE